MGAHSPPGPEGGPFEAALLERERELGEIDAAVALATVGSGRLLVFEGHAGIGKSRMVRAARVRAEAAGRARR
jgi:predicted ATPase